MNIILEALIILLAAVACFYFGYCITKWFRAYDIKPQIAKLESKRDSLLNKTK